MFGIGLALFLAVTVLCVAIAGRMASDRGRSVPGWMLAAAIFGPVPIALLVYLPKKP